MYCTYCSRYGRLEIYGMPAFIIIDQQSLFEVRTVVHAGNLEWWELRQLHKRADCGYFMHMHRLFSWSRRAQWLCSLYRWGWLEETRRAGPWLQKRWYQRATGHVLRPIQRVLSSCEVWVTQCAILVFCNKPFTISGWSVLDLVSAHCGMKARLLLFTISTLYSTLIPL